MVGLFAATIAHKPAAPIGFPVVANADSRMPPRKTRYVTASVVARIQGTRSRAFQDISRTLPRFVGLSNRSARVLDVSLGPDGGRKVFSKITLGDELRALEALGAKIGDSLWHKRHSSRRAERAFPSATRAVVGLRQRPAPQPDRSGHCYRDRQAESASVPVRDRIHVLKQDLRRPPGAPT